MYEQLQFWCFERWCDGRPRFTIRGHLGTGASCAMRLAAITTLCFHVKSMSDGLEFNFEDTMLP